MTYGFALRDNRGVNEAFSSLKPTSGVNLRVCSALRAGSVQALLALTTISALGLAGDTGKNRDGLVRRIPGVTAIYRWLEVGKASWYGLKFQGRKTATGEKYDMNDLTCAHRSLPLGSWVRVTNLRNHKSVVVRVNDRGPMSGDRIVDLSYAAAHAVGMDGLAKVRLESASGPGLDPARPLLAQLKMPASLLVLPLPVQ